MIKRTKEEVADLGGILQDQFLGILGAKYCHHQGLDLDVIYLLLLSTSLILEASLVILDFAAHI